MLWIFLVPLTAVLSGLAGWQIGGNTITGIFTGVMGLLLALGIRDWTKHKHAIFAGTLFAGTVVLYFGGVQLAIAGAVLAFLAQLAVHDFLQKKDWMLPVGIANAILCGAVGFNIGGGDKLLGLAFAIGGFLAQVGVYDYYLQRNHTIRRNFPVIGWCRYGFELIGDELRQYWFMGNREERPYNRIQRRFIYRAAKGINYNIGFGTEEPYRDVGKIHMLNTAYPIPEDGAPLTLPSLVIGKRRRKPYNCNWPIGIGHMSVGALSEEAASALSSGAMLANIHMGTGEGGLWDVHLNGVTRRVPWQKMARYYRDLAAYRTRNLLASWRLCSAPTGDEPVVPKGEIVGGGKLVLELGPAKFGFRRIFMDPFMTPAGRQFRKVWSNELDLEKLIEAMQNDQIVMLMVKGMQGAKPGQGGKLPKEKMTRRIAEFRGVDPSKDCYSPNAWSEYTDDESMLRFINMLQEATGKPVGIKIVVGEWDWLTTWAEKMKELGMHPDFIYIDGGEGGTGAAPGSLADNVGLPLLHAIPLIDNALRRVGLRDEVNLIGAGGLVTGADILIAIAMGLDVAEEARPFLMAEGCIMAMRCHTNRCPVGITTNDPRLTRGFDPEDKFVKVGNYGMVLQREILTILKSMGVRTPWELTRRHLSVVSEPLVSKRLSDLHPYEDGSNGERRVTLGPPAPVVPGKFDDRGPKLIQIEKYSRNH